MLELIPFSNPTYWLSYQAAIAIGSSATTGDVELATGPFLGYVAAHRGFFEEAERQTPISFDGRFAYVDPDLAQRMIEPSPLWCRGWCDAGNALAEEADGHAQRGQTATAAKLLRRPSVSHIVVRLPLGGSGVASIVDLLMRLGDFRSSPAPLLVAMPILSIDAGHRTPPGHHAQNRCVGR